MRRRHVVVVGPLDCYHLAIDQQLWLLWISAVLLLQLVGSDGRNRPARGAVRRLLAGHHLCRTVVGLVRLVVVTLQILAVLVSRRAAGMARSSGLTE
jgi:hypothetical protein